MMQFGLDESLTNFPSLVAFVASQLNKNNIYGLKLNKKIGNKGT